VGIPAGGVLICWNFSEQPFDRVGGARALALDMPVKALGAAVSQHGSGNAPIGHQLSDPLARVKHACLYGALRDAGDLGNLID
jgi:hypothetical protein